MNDESALLAAIAADPDDIPSRLVYADLLEEHGHPGAAYLRAEAALSRADPAEAPTIRRSMIDLAPTLPASWLNRMEQPDVLLAPPVPFRPGWWRPDASRPIAYRSLANLDAEAFSPELPWLSGESVEDRVDQAEYEEEESSALDEIIDRSAELRLTLPPGFKAFAQDFPRRNAISEGDSYFEFCLHAATINDFPSVCDGRLVTFFADMNYGRRHQLAWALYLVPRCPWHCVVGFELGDDADDPLPTDPAKITYCAPSFQAFLYRWRNGTGCRT